MSKFSAFKAKISGGKARGTTSILNGNKENSMEIDSYKSFYSGYESKYNNILQPGGHSRTHMALKHISSKGNKEFPYPDRLFYDFVLKSSKLFSNVFGKVLETVSETYEQMVEIKSIRHENVKTNTFDPIQNTTTSSLNAIVKLQKNLATAETEFMAAEKKRETVGDPKSIERRETANRQQNIVREELKLAIEDFLKAEPERISALIKAAEIEVEYHKNAQTVMQKLVSDLQVYRAQSSEKHQSMSNGQIYSNQSEDSHEVKSTFNFNNNQNLGFSTTVEPIASLTKSFPTGNNKPCCRALYDFEAETEDDLALRKDDVATLIEQADEQWYYGELNGKRGHFPIDFVEVINPL